MLQRPSFSLLSPRAGRVQRSGWFWLDIRKEDDSFYWYKPRRQEAGVLSNEGECVIIEVFSDSELEFNVVQTPCAAGSWFVCMSDLQNDALC